MAAPTGLTMAMRAADAPTCSVQENETEFKALQLWLLKKTLARGDPFMELLLSVDIMPCLSFENKEVRRVWLGGWGLCTVGGIVE